MIHLITFWFRWAQDVYRMWHKIQLIACMKTKDIYRNNGYYCSACKEGCYRLLQTGIGVLFQALQLWIKITMSNELLDLDTLGKECSLQSTWLFNCLLGGGKVQREGTGTVLHFGASTARCQVVEGCSTVPAIANTSGSHCRHGCLEMDEIVDKKNSGKCI